MVNSVDNCPPSVADLLTHTKPLNALRTFAIKRILEAPYVDFGVIKDPRQLRVCPAPRGREMVDHLPHSFGAYHNV